MVDERTAYWGDADEARYRTRDDDPTGGDYVVAETLDANGDPVDVLLRWDDTAGEWVSGGPVNMNGEDVTNVGTLDAGSVSTKKIANVADYIVETGDELENAAQSISPQETIALGGGDYTVSGALDFSGLQNIRMSGAGRQTTTITVDADVPRAVNLSDSQRVRLDGFRLETSTSSGDGIGVASGSTGPRRSFFQDIIVSGFGGDGFHLIDTWQNAYLHLRATGNERGLLFNSSGQDNSFFSCSFAQSNSEAIRLVNGGATFHGGEASTSEYGVVLPNTDARETQFIGLHHENNTKADYYASESVSPPAGSKIAPARLDAPIGIDLEQARDFHIELGATRWVGSDDSTCLKMGDSGLGTTAFRTTVVGSPRDEGGTNSTVIDTQSVTDGIHYSPSGVVDLDTS